MKRFFTTDLACEREGGAHRREYLLYGCRVCELREMCRGESMGYTVVHTHDGGHAVRALSELLLRVSKRAVSDPRCVLVACLGNLRITPDSLGPCTARRLEVTRHVMLLDKVAFSRFGTGALCAVTPGVLGDTGVEAAELLRGVVHEVGADLVVAVDALATRSTDHLGKVVQICDSGLRPGSGADNGRAMLDRASVGCPVISLGIPTVIRSDTLICDALSRAGICGVGDALSEYLAGAGQMLVAPADVDAVIDRGSALLADAICACFGLGRL